MGCCGGVLKPAACNFWLKIRRKLHKIAILCNFGRFFEGKLHVASLPNESCVVFASIKGGAIYDTAFTILPFRIRAFSGLQCGPDLDVAAAGKTCALVKLFARLADAETKSSYVAVNNVLCRKRLEAFNYQPVVDFLAVILQEAARAGLGHRQISTSMCITLEAGILNVILSPSKLISSNAFSKTTSG